MHSIDVRILKNLDIHFAYFPYKAKPASILILIFLASNVTKQYALLHYSYRNK